MREDEIDTLDDIGCFLQGKTCPPMALQGGKEAVYKWLEKTLVRFRYQWLDKHEKGLVLRYIEPLVSQRFIEQIQLVSHIVDLHFAVVFRNYLI